MNLRRFCRLGLSNVLWTMGALAGAAIASPRESAAQTPTFLYTGTGDGFIQPRVDEFGTLSGCGPTAPGLFDPLGPFPPEGTVCSIGIQIFDQAGTIKQPLPAASGGCGGGSPHVATLVPGSDVLVGTHSRFSSFTLSGFPGLTVSLWQTVCTGGILTQTYTFENGAAVPYSLRIARDADLDVDVFDFQHNYGLLLAPGVPAVTDASGQVSVALSSGGDGSLEGYRIYQATGNGAQIFQHSWGHFGFPTANLNGFYRTLMEPWGSACGLTLGVDEIAYSQAQAQTSFGDTAVALQTLLDVPPGQTRTYVAQTFWGPSVPPNDPPAPNCEVLFPGTGPSSGSVTGRVTFDDDASCTFNSPEIGAVGRWVEVTGTGGTYYAHTDTDGNYAIAVPPGNYAVSLVPNAYSAETCGAPVTYNVAVAPGLAASHKDFFVLTAGCNATLWIGASYPQNAGSVHDVINQPCPCDEITYCVNISNTGSTPVGGNVVVTLPAELAYVTAISPPFPPPPTAYANACSVVGPPSTSGGASRTCCNQTRDVGQTLTWQLASPIPANSGTSSQCSICYRAVECGILDTPPVAQSTTAALTAAGSCQISGGALGERVVCSRDPNGKDGAPLGCGAGGVIARDQEITYTVRFQNEGNGPAHRVRIEDALDPSLDLGSLVIVGASHAITSFEIRPDRVLVADFDGIELPPKDEDPEGSQGLIEIRIRPLAGLDNGTVITNQASIVFDHNDAILTETTVHTVADHVWNEVALLAEESLDIGSGATIIGGAAAVNADNGTATLSSSAVVAGPGVWLAADSLVLKPGAVAGDVFANQVNAPGQITGTWEPFVGPVAPIPSLPVYATGSAAISVPNGGAAKLVAGDYGTVSVGQGGTLTLLGGDYHVTSIQLDNSAKVLVQAPVDVWAKQEITLAKGASWAPTAQGPDAKDIRIQVAGVTFSTGENAVMTANVLAPIAAADVGPKSLFFGAIAAKTITLKPNAKVTAAVGCW